MKKSMERDVIKILSKWVGAIYCSITICGSKSKGSRWSRDFCGT
jgi:hypothetical protein